MKKYHTGKLKYGSVSALMIVMVLAALIALNAGVYALEKKKGWRTGSYPRARKQGKY